MSLSSPVVSSLQTKTTKTKTTSVGGKENDNNVNNNTTMIIRDQRYWDVKVGPIKRHMFNDKLISTVRGSLGKHIVGVAKRRRIVLQIIVNSNSNSTLTKTNDKNKEKGKGGKGGGGSTTTENDDILDQLLLLSSSTIKQSSSSSSSSSPPSPSSASSSRKTKTSRNIKKEEEEVKNQQIVLLNENDRVIIKVLKPRRHWGFISPPPQKPSSTSSSSGQKKRLRRRKFGGTTTGDRFRKNRFLLQRQEEHTTTSKASSGSADGKKSNSLKQEEEEEEEDDADADAESVSSSSSSSSSSIDEEEGNEDKTDSTITTTTTTTTETDFVEFQQFTLDEISNLRIIGEHESSTSTTTSSSSPTTILEVTMGRGVDTIVRDITFQSSQQIYDFVQLLEILRHMKVKSNIDKAAAKTSSSSTKHSSPLDVMGINKLATAFKVNNKNKSSTEQTSTSIASKVSSMANKIKSPIPPSALQFSSYQKQQQQQQQQQNIDDDIKFDMIDPSSPIFTTMHSFDEGDDDDEEETTMINLLIEIVSATDLPNADTSSWDGRSSSNNISKNKNKSDPFVKVWLGTKEIHRTAVFKDDDNPIWTIETGSLFMLSMPITEFFASSTDGLIFEVIDYDGGRSKNDLLGRVILPQDQVLELANNNNNSKNKNINEQPRHEFPLTDLLPGFDVNQVVFPPTLNLRIKIASHADYKFLKILHKLSSRRKKATTKALGVYSDSAYVGPKRHKVNRLLRRETKTRNGVTLYKIKPNPDPSRPEHLTEWMTSADIQDECYQPSKNWIETGSGQIGYLYLEVLKCDDLPNLDDETFSSKGNVTDAFCGIVYEDAIVNTDVINDELSPRWMSWTQRAFVFRIQHLSTQLMIGVFDYNQLSSANIVGRVSINLTNFESDIEYVLTYPLYESVFPPIIEGDDNGTSSFIESPSSKRIPRGTITIRLRMKIHNYRSAVLASLKPSSRHFVNVAQRSDFRMAQYITCGDENMYVVNFEALKSYSKELEEYAVGLYHIKQAVLTVLLWRGHHEICGCHKKGGTRRHPADDSNEEPKISRRRCCRSVKLPLHSIVAFTWGVFLVENYNLIPSFVLFCVSWFLLATNDHGQKHPDPWHRCPTFGEIWKALIFNHGRRSKELSGYDDDNDDGHDDGTIPDEHTSLLATEHEEEELNLKKFRKSVQIYMVENPNPVEKLFAEEEQVAEDEKDIETEAYANESIQPRLLKRYILPIQRLLGKTCVSIRIATNVLNWNESIYAFFITNVCLIGSLLLLFVPWGWIIRWVLRIIVWTFLGPWMKLVDIFIIRKLEEDGDNAVKKWQRQMERRSKTLLKRKDMILKENVQKQLAMKRYMFGYYVARVPSQKEYRYADIPTSMSSRAVPSRHDLNEDNLHSPGVNVVERTHGQSLVGDMIPIWGNEGDDAFLNAKAFKVKRKLFGSKKERISASD